jgi:uncharacterized repeat protein (TIGR01451 family)
MIAGIGPMTLGLMLMGSVLRDALLQQPDADGSAATELARIHGWNGFARTANSVTQPLSVSGMALAILVMALLVPMTIVVLRKARRLNARQLAYVSGGITIGLLALLIVSGATSKAVMAVSSYGPHVPNFGASLAVNSAGAHCNTCHDPSGSPDIATVTAFGDSFAAGGYAWTIALAQTDPDGDGFSNGEELQDPTGATVGSTASSDPYGDVAFLSSPGINTATYANVNSGYGTRGYPVPPTVTTMSLVNAATIAGNVVVTAGVRYAGLSKEVWTLKNSGGAIVYTSTINYAPLTGTNYINKHCLGANAPTTSCAAWNSTALPNGNYTVTLTVYDRRAASLGGPQTHSLARSVTINNAAAASADLRIAKSASSAAVIVGSPLTYTLAITNAGPDAASNVKITDTLPASVTFKAAIASAGSCSGTATVVCSLGGLANNGTATVSIVVTATAVGNVNNTAQVAATEADPATGNNTSNASVTINSAPAADVQIVKSASASQVLVHSPVTFSLVVHNNGPVTATNVLVTDTMPSGLTIVTRSTTQGSCNGSSTLATCALGTLANGGSATVTLSVSTTITGTFNNTALVGAAELDTNLVNNQSSASVKAMDQFYTIFLPLVLR